MSHVAGLWTSPEYLWAWWWWSFTNAGPEPITNLQWQISWPQDGCFCVVGWNHPRTDSPETGFQVTLAEVWCCLKIAGHPSVIKHGNGKSLGFFLDMEFHSGNQEHWDGQDESQFWHIFVVPKMYPILEPSEEVQDEMGSQPVSALVLGP